MNITQFFSDKKILIIDDCRMIFTATRIMLVNHGCKIDNITQAIDAKNSIEICETQAFDFILCDYNLGKGTDGLQLLEILHQKHLIAEKTVIFIVTAESKKSVFYGFAEYEPDGYLVKPVKIHEVAGQLLNAFALKQSLLNIDNIYQKQGKEAAIKQAFAYPQTKFIRLKQAQIFVQAKDYQKAKQIYVTLVKENVHKAKLGLAELLIDQKQHELALQYIESLIDIPEIKIQALQLKANCYLLNAQMHKALQAFTEASELSPYNIERLLALFNITEIMNDNELRLDIGTKISHRAINSHWESFSTLSYRLRALLRHSYNDLQQRTTQSLIYQQQRNLEKQFSSITHKLQRQVFKAQIQVSKGDIKSSYMTLAEIEAGEQQTQAQSDTTFELDMVFLYMTLGQFDNALLRIKKLQSIPFKNSMLPISQGYLFHHLANKIKHKKESLTSLLQQAEQTQLAGQDLKTASHLLNAWLAQPFSTELAQSLLQALTKAVPMEHNLEQLKNTLMQIRQTLEVEAGSTKLAPWATLALKQVEHAFSELQQRNK